MTAVSISIVCGTSTIVIGRVQVSGLPACPPSSQVSTEAAPTASSVQEVTPNAVTLSVRSVDSLVSALVNDEGGPLATGAALKCTCTPYVGTVSTWTVAVSDSGNEPASKDITVDYIKKTPKTKVKYIAVECVVTASKEASIGQVRGLLALKWQAYPNVITQRHAYAVTF